MKRILLVLTFMFVCFVLPLSTMAATTTPEQKANVSGAAAGAATGNAAVGTEAKIGGAAANTSGYRLFPTMPTTCTDKTALSCFINQVWSFSQIAILLLAIAAFVVAGLIYMTSGGNPKRVEMAKKIIIGALSAIGVIILGRFFLINVVGVTWTN